VILGWHRTDYFLLHSINRFARRFFVLDYGIRTIERDMFSNLPLLTLVWYVWFKYTHVQVRAGILVGVLASFFAGVLSRGIQLTLPTHLRPLHDPALHFQVPFGIDPDSLNHWSSFPSDHAAVLFGLAMTIFLVDRAAGWLAILCATIVNLVRVYLGFHNPSDILCGAMLGIVLVLMTYGLRRRTPVLDLFQAFTRNRAVFYAVAFYVCFGIVTLFTDFRDTASGFLQGLHGRVPVPAIQPTRATRSSEGKEICHEPDDARRSSACRDPSLRRRSWAPKCSIPICLADCSTTDQTAQSLRLAPSLPPFERLRNSLPSSILAADIQALMPSLTQSGTATVRMRLPFPSRSAISLCTL